MRKIFSVQPVLRRLRLPFDLPPSLAVLLVLACAVHQMLPSIYTVIEGWNVPKTPTWVGVAANDPHRGTQPIADIDTVLIHGGLTAAPHFRDTFRWWHSTWAGQVPFYRPLSSLAFWVEWRLFGDHEIRYLPLAMALHLLVVFQFTLLAYRFFRRFAWDCPGLACLLSGLLFVDGLWALPTRHGTLLKIFILWKNLPDSLATFFFCLSLTCYLRYQEKQSQKTVPQKQVVSAPLVEKEQGSGVSNSQGRYLPETRRRRIVESALVAASPLAYLASCLSKESGVIVPFLLIWLEWDSLKAGGRSRLQAIRRMAPTCLMLPFFLIIRTLSLHTTTGFRYGSNGSWKTRLSEDMFGIVGRSVEFAHWPPLFMAISLLVLLLLIPWANQPASERLRRRRWVLTLLLPVLIPLMGSFVINDTVEIPWRPVVLFLQFFEKFQILDALGILLFLLGSVNTFRYRLQAGLFCYTWALCSLLLLTFSPYALHRNYLMEGGFALLIGGGLALGKVFRYSGIQVLGKPLPDT